MVIGQVERDIDDTHPELRGVLVEDTHRQYAEEDWPGRLITPAEAKDHALATASLAAGRRTGVNGQQQGMHGVAYEAKVRFVSELNSRFLSYRQPGGSSLLHSQDAAMLYLNDLVEIGFVTISTGFDDIGAGLSREQVESVSGGAILALQQAGTPAAERTIWVFSAGNEELQHPHDNLKCRGHPRQPAQHCDQSKRYLHQSTRHRHQCVRHSQYTYHSKLLTDQEYCDQPKSRQSLLR